MAYITPTLFDLLRIQLEALEEYGASKDEMYDQLTIWMDEASLKMEMRLAKYFKLNRD